MMAVLNFSDRKYQFNKTRAGKPALERLYRN